MNTPTVLLALVVILCASACTSTTTTQMVTYDTHGDTVTIQTTTVERNDTSDEAKELGDDVEEGVVTGYEWTRDKTIEGYHWVKKKSVEAYESIKE